MDLVIIGAGNVATHLGVALKNAGINIRQVYSRTEDSARTLAEKLNTNFTTDLGLIFRNADLYLFSVKDSVLESLIAGLQLPNAIQIHTAGSIPMQIFQNHATRYGVFYPLQTFSKAREVDFSKVPLCIEACNPELESLLISLANNISSKCYLIDSVQRMKLHLSAVFACNFTNYMYSVAEEIVNEAGLPFEILKPLIAETADKTNSLSPVQAQTGPAMRYDLNVIDKHLNLLCDKPELKQLYEEISKQIYRKYN